MQTNVNGGGKMRPFFMEDILYIANGVRLTKADMTIGNRPFVGASEACNGITEFVDNFSEHKLVWWGIS